MQHLLKQEVKLLVNETYYVKTEEKEHTVKIQNEDEKFYSYDAELVENPTGTLVEKTITENGEYLPASDNADGYSKVTVEVPSQVNKLAQVADKTITEITADDLAGAAEIKPSVFMDCQDLVGIVIPDSVLEIGNMAFRYCRALKTIVIGDGVTKIGQQAFYYCSDVLTIQIGDGVTNIGDSAFNGCTSLNSITIMATEPPALPSVNPLLNTNACPIYVPATSVDAYKAATNWASFASRIQAIPA